MTTKTMKDAVEALMLADEMLETAERMRKLGLPQGEIDLVSRVGNSLNNLAPSPAAR